MRAYNIIDRLEKWISPELIDSWDRTGFQIGDGKEEVKGILLALDVTDKVIDRALKTGCNMIITHHPFIFNPIESITDRTYKGRLINIIIKNDLIIYNAHSNLDLVEGGVNDILSGLIGLKNPTPLNLVHQDLFGKESIKYGYGRVGDIDEMTLNDLLINIKDKIDIETLIVYGDTKEPINRIAICGGSGSDFILDAKQKGAQVYITGDIKYHDAQLAYEEGIIVIDATHYHTEKIILAELKERLNKFIDITVKIEIYDEMTFPYSIK